MSGETNLTSPSQRMAKARTQTGSGIRIRVTCGKRASDVRAMWLFGLQGEERRRAEMCRRVEGHRGPCLRNPNFPLPPLRPIMVELAAVSGYHYHDA